MVRKYWFIILFACTLMFPLYGHLLDANITLNGVTSVLNTVEANLTTIGDGTYQTYLNDEWELNFPGKKFLLRIRNQMLYSVCKISPNSNVVIGKEDYLYEPAYIYWETQAFPPSSEEYFETLGSNLSKLQKLLDESDKELYIFITPSKAHFCREYIPASLEYLSNEELYSYTNYEMLLETLSENKIPFFDSIAFIETNLDSMTFESPIFYKSGIHWSHMWGQTCALQFLKYINSCSRYDLTTLKVEELSSTDPIAPDTDLYSSLNLLFEAQEPWYATEVTIEEYGLDHPNVFMRGGSFMGQSLQTLIQNGIFNKDVHFENNYYFMNQYTSKDILSAYNAYEEIDLDTLVGQSDILVLEVNDGAISTMSWGFIEYLLEHPDFLDRTY